MYVKQTGALPVGQRLTRNHRVQVQQTHARELPQTQTRERAQTQKEMVWPAQSINQNFAPSLL